MRFNVGLFLCLNIGYNAFSPTTPAPREERGRVNSILKFLNNWQTHRVINARYA